MGTGANITMIEDADVIHRNIITEYGKITVEDIDASVQEFIGQQKQ